LHAQQLAATLNFETTKLMFTSLTHSWRTKGATTWYWNTWCTLT